MLMYHFEHDHCVKMFTYKLLSSMWNGAYMVRQGMRCNVVANQAKYPHVLLEKMVYQHPEV